MVFSDVCLSMSETYNPFIINKRAPRTYFECEWVYAYSQNSIREFDTPLRYHTGMQIGKFGRVQPARQTQLLNLALEQCLGYTY